MTAAKMIARALLAAAIGTGCVVDALSPRMSRIVARYPRCFERCGGTTGTLDRMLGLAMAGKGEEAKGVACSQMDRFLCMYQPRNLVHCYPFIVGEDWGSWNLPLPLTSGLLRRQCRRRKEEPSEDTQTQPEEASEGQPQEELTNALSPEMREVILAYPECFKKCRATVAPLDAMIRMRSEDRPDRTADVACANEDQFECMYGEEVCADFLRSEQASGAVPPTAEAMQQQCEQRVEERGSGDIGMRTQPEEVSESQPHEDLTNALSPEMREVILAFPECFKKCRATVAPLDAMIRMQSEDRPDHTMDVACANEEQFECMYGEDTCADFLHSEQASGVVPPTADAMQQQCEQRTAERSADVVDTPSAASEGIIIP